MNQIANVETFVDNYNRFIRTHVEKIFSDLEDPELQGQAGDIAEFIALICGIWNGVVDFVSSTFKFFGSLLEAPFDIAGDFQSAMETVDNILALLKDEKLWVNLVDAASEGMKEMVQYLKSEDSEDLNWVRIHYITGFAVSFVGTFFVPGVNLSKVAEISKIGDVGSILAKINQELAEVVSKTFNLAKTQAAGGYQKIGKTIQEFLELFIKGGQKLRQFIEDLWKKIAAWFLKNKEKYQELARYGKAFLERTAKTYAKKYPDGKLYKILKLREAYHLYGKQGKILVQKVDIAFESILKNSESIKEFKKKVMISGMLYKGDKTSRVFTGVNFTQKEIKIEEVIKFIKNMHPVLKKRYELHLKEVIKGLKTTPEMITKAGEAASHGEIRALNELFYYLEESGIKVTDDIFKDIMGYNRFFVKEGSQPPCVHCFYLTDGVQYLKSLR